MFINDLFYFIKEAKLSIYADDNQLYFADTSTGSGLFALLSRQFEQIFGQILSIRVKLRSNTILVPWRYIKRGTGSLPVDVSSSRTSLLNVVVSEWFRNQMILNPEKCKALVLWRKTQCQAITIFWRCCLTTSYTVDLLRFLIRLVGRKVRKGKKTGVHNISAPLF